MGEPIQYERGQVLPGTVYRVVRHLATGGMGSVYDVEDTTVEKRYVLKTLHPQLIAREDLARRMRDEARALAKLNHPNIVDVITAGVTQDAVRMPFYVMERLNGQNLRVIIAKKGSLDLSHALHIAIDVADALEHAHENNIVHRDVKPENIFLHRNSNGTTTTKLLDFGIVRLLDRKASHTHGKFIGTLRYASPEQIMGDKLGPGTDIYSLGVVLYEMVCGRGPFDDVGDGLAIGAAHAHNPPPPPSRFVRLPAELERIIVATLSKQPTERPRDCFTFATELRKILRDEEAAPRSATAVNPLTAAAPPTVGVSAQALIGTEMVHSGPPPTHQGMVPPSAVGPTLLNAGLAAMAVAPTMASETGPGGQPIDRNAPTRASAPHGATQRLAVNDTRMESAGAVQSVQDAFGERAPLVVPSTTGTNPSGEILFPLAHSTAGTGPMAGEAATRPPDRRMFLPLLGAAILSVIVLVGAVLVATKPWRHASEPEPPVVGAPSAAAPPPLTAEPKGAPAAVPAATAAIGSASAAVTPSATAATPAPKRSSTGGTGATGATGAGEATSKKAAPAPPGAKSATKPEDVQF